MAPVYKVTYFDLPALGEPIRFLLSYGGIEFEDNRIQKEQWPALKPTIPFGQLPILEHNGETANQSIAISRYLGKEVKLNGKDAWEDLLIDSFVDTFNDVRRQMANYKKETNEKVQATLKETLFNETIPFYLSRFDANAKSGYLVLGRLTWADIYFASVIDYTEKMLGAELIDKYSNLKKVKENVFAIPNIKAYVDKRPPFNLP